MTSYPTASENRKYIPILVILAFLPFYYSHAQENNSLFASEELLSLEISGDTRKLLNDRGDDAPYHNITLSVRGKEKGTVTLPIRVKTRGRFRKARGNCTYPPLLLNFSEKDTKGTVFSGQKKVKLVTPCKGDQYVVREYLVYKLYNLITPKSFKARLVNIIFNDSVRNKKTDPMYGLLLEEEDQLAARNNTVAVTRLLQPQQVQRSEFIKMAVFEYLISNTDWSIQYLQNIKLIAADTLKTPTAVPYDFDHAGIVDAPYAYPAELLLLSSVRERRYRGFCIPDLKQFDEAIALFNQLKDQIYSVYTSNQLLEESYKKSTVRFLDEFYKTINNPKLAKEAFGYPCENKDGTANVVIKPLND